LKVLEDCPGDLNFWYRHISKGAWPFSTADHGWPISDCTAEGLKVKFEQTVPDHIMTKISDIYVFVQAILLLSTFPSETVGGSLDVKRLYDAVNVILSLQVIIRCVALLELQSWNWYMNKRRIYGLIKVKICGNRLKKDLVAYTHDSCN
jgi:cycloartenol synthase